MSHKALFFAYLMPLSDETRLKSDDLIYECGNSNDNRVAICTYLTDDLNLQVPFGHGDYWLISLMSHKALFFARIAMRLISCRSVLADDNLH